MTDDHVATRRAGVHLSRQLLCVTDPARYCSKAARALIREMFGLSVTIVPQGCFLPAAQVHGHLFVLASCPYQYKEVMKGGRLPLVPRKQGIKSVIALIALIVCLLCMLACLVMGSFAIFAHLLFTRSTLILPSLHTFAPYLST